MPEEPPVEFLWFLDVSALLAERYLYQWIAIDGERIAQGARFPADIIAANSESLETVLARTDALREPSRFYYAFVDDVLEPIERNF